MYNFTAVQCYYKYYNCTIFYSCWSSVSTTAVLNLVPPPAKYYYLVLSSTSATPLMLDPTSPPFPDWLPARPEVLDEVLSYASPPTQTLDPHLPAFPRMFAGTSRSVGKVAILLMPAPQMMKQEIG